MLYWYSISTSTKVTLRSATTIRIPIVPPLGKQGQIHDLKGRLGKYIFAMIQVVYLLSSSLWQNIGFWILTHLIDCLNSTLALSAFFIPLSAFSLLCFLHILLEWMDWMQLKNFADWTGEISVNFPPPVADNGLPCCCQWPALFPMEQNCRGILSCCRTERQGRVVGDLLSTTWAIASFFHCFVVRLLFPPVAG